MLIVLVRFEGEGDVKKVDPFNLPTFIRGQVGKVKYGGFLRYGNLLIECNTVCGEGKEDD